MILLNKYIAEPDTMQLISQVTCQDNWRLGGRNQDPGVLVAGQLDM